MMLVRYKSNEYPNSPFHVSMLLDTENIHRHSNTLNAPRSFILGHSRQEYCCFPK